MHIPSQPDLPEPADDAVLTVSHDAERHRQWWCPAGRPMFADGRIDDASADGEAVAGPAPAGPFASEPLHDRDAA